MFSVQYTLFLGRLPLEDQGRGAFYTVGFVFRLSSTGELGERQGCIRREGTSQAALEAITQAVGGGCQSGWCGERVLSR